MTLQQKTWRDPTLRAAAIGGMLGLIRLEATLRRLPGPSAKTRARIKKWRKLPAAPL